MGLLRGRALALTWAGLLFLRGGCAGSSSHSLRFFHMGVSEPGQGLPRFLAAGYVDDQLFVHYNSEERRATPRAQWIEKAGRETPQYWDRQAERAQGAEAMFRLDLAAAMQCYNQSGGFHTWQAMYGCRLSEDKPSRGYRQYGYDGRDFIAFDKETLTWTAVEGPAKVAKRRWEADLAWSQTLKTYLEEECIEWLRIYLRYGKETLLRKERPVVTVTRKGSHEGLETLLCRAHGFYPKEIDVTWRRDGEVRLGDTFQGVVSPNADGTYFTWLSIEVDPQERSLYLCHVEHDGLQEPLDVAVEESVSILLGLLVGVALIVLLSLIGIILYLKRRPERAAYRAASGS